MEQVDWNKDHGSPRNDNSIDNCGSLAETFKSKINMKIHKDGQRPRPIYRHGISYS